VSGRRTFLPPLAAYAAMTVVAAISAEVAGFSAFDPQTWSRWDSFHYVNIALHGYDEGPLDCTGGKLVCGHAGWLPGYPALFGLPVQLGLGATPTGLVTSWLFGLATLTLLWTRFLQHGPEDARVAGLLFAAAVPGMIYHHTVFPLSALAFFSLLSLLLLARERWFLAGLSGAAAAATYPLGAVLSPLAAAWIAIARRTRPLRERVVPALTAGALVAAGFGVVLLVQRLELGEWLGYFEVQDHPLRSPFRGLSEELTRDLRETDLEAVVGAQAVLTAALALAIVLLLVLRRSQLTRLDVLCGCFALAVWVLPLTQTGVSVYRSNAALLSAAPLLRHLGKGVRWAFVAVALLISAPMSALFFKGSLV
jgi:hypothetical protein